MSAQVTQASAEQMALAKEVVRPNPIKDRMMDNKIAFSFGLRMAFSTEMPLIAKRAGYTGLLMNLEHMAMGMETMKDISVCSLNVGISPMVVVPTCAPEWISRCLDSGAQTIVVPHVNTVEDARMCVNASKYPPKGHRSLTMVTPMTQYCTQLRPDITAALVNDTTLIMPMIETQEGLENVSKIAAVDGLDALMIGCADLCSELGIPGQYDSPVFHSAVDRIAKAALAASDGGRSVFVGLGGLETRPDLLKVFTKKYSCIRFVMAGRDVSMLINAMGQQATAMNALSEGL